MKKYGVSTLLILFLLGFGTTVYCQSGGKLFIEEKGFLSVFGQHNFTKGSGFLAPGRVTTSREGGKGYLNFTKGSDWKGASDGRFVDGYVCVFHDQEFIFPIGNKNQYRPIKSSGSRKTTAAYYYVSPAEKVQQTGGSNSPTINGKTSDIVISRISNREYWDVGGKEAVELSFLWGEDSNIANISGGKLENLILVGWRNGQWEAIPSIVEEQSPDLFLQKHDGLSLSPSFNQGVISTSQAIVPNDYEFITIGAKEEVAAADGRARVFESDIITVYPNPVVEEMYINLEKIGGRSGIIQIYNIYGVKIEEREINEDSNYLQQFDASTMTNGMYEIFVKIGIKTVSQKFVVGRLY